MKVDEKEKQQLNEELDSLILHDVAQQYLEDAQEYEALLKETLAAGPHAFSQEHEARMKRLIAAADKKKSTPFSGRGVKRLGIAAAAVVLFFSAGGTYLVSDADWEDIRSFFIQRQPTHTEVILPEDIGEEYWNILKNTGWNKFYYPSYLPDGFTLRPVVPMDDLCSLIFEHDNKRIEILQSPLVNGVYYHVDTEGTKVWPMDINGYEGEYFEKGDYKTIHYKNEDCYFVIVGKDISKNQLVKVTKNLKTIENTK